MHRPAADCTQMLTATSGADMIRSIPCDNVTSEVKAHDAQYAASPQRPSWPRSAVGFVGVGAAPANAVDTSWGAKITVPR